MAPSTPLSSIDGAPIKLSVVIPVYNAAHTIAAQLDALLRQQCTAAWEIIVADNGSTDASIDVVVDYARQHPRVRSIDASQQRGPSYARNAGVAQSSGELVAFCDADDVVADGWLSAVETTLQHHAAVTGPLELARLNQEWLQHAYGTKLATEPQSFAGIFPFGASANLGVRRSVFREIGGFDPAIEVGEDIEFCLRLWSAGYSLGFAPTATVHYRLRDTRIALWRQAVQYGGATPHIWKLLARRGHPVSGRFRGTRNWLWLVRNLPSLRTPAGRLRWMVVLGGSAGRVVGSVRHRCLYF